MISFDDWGSKACTFFRNRRLAPFDECGIVLEDILRRRVEEKRDAFVSVASGDYIKGFRLAFDEFDAAGFIPPPNMILPMLETLYDGDLTKVAQTLENWEQKWQRGFRYDLLGYFEEVAATDKELLRHYELLPEQRERLQFMRAHPEATEIGNYVDAWISEKRIHSTDQEIARQACLFGWAHVWNLVSQKETLSAENWQRLYHAVTITMLTPDLYQDIPLHSFELAEMSYLHAPDSVRKLLGGLLYAKVLEVEGVQALKKPVIAELERILAGEDLFSSSSFVRFDAAKDAGYFVEDTEHYFVFKRTHKQEVDALSGIAAIMINPSMTYYRVAARYSPRFFNSRDGSPNFPRSPEEFHALLDEAKMNPQLKAYFEIPCVKLGGLVLKLPGDARVLSMHNEGKTAAEQLDLAADDSKKMEICRDALTMLSKFHLMVTENLVHYNGKWYPAPGMQGYVGRPAIPQIKYRNFLERRIAGTKDVPRLPRNSHLENVLDATDDLSAFLQRGCVGAVLLDAHDANITEHGVIDVAKLSIANFFYDVARFLYGNSFERKRNLNFHALREHYISTLIAIVSETHIAHNDESGGDFESVCRDYKNWRTRDELLAAHTPAYKQMMRRGHNKRVSPSFIEAQCSHTLLDLVMSWDCCKPDAAEHMREYCQAAAIFVSMGETGALLHQFSSASSSHKDFLEQELQYAVANSFALMREQGFTTLAGNWRTYLAMSGKIPDAYLQQESLLPANTFIPDLAKRVFDAVYAAPRRFPVLLPNLTYT
ncbi:hypothetical protein HZC31_08835 [Candidatus Woesearchaeota archaeon]|nr:hypothetical protein [Candidatus Woesearchaeota archaeon]